MCSKHPAFAARLPRHDEIGPGRRIFEAACITMAATLLVWHWTRFFVLPAETHGWSLAILPLGMAAADLLSGLVHWAADTWGSQSMPILGRRLLHPFRVHHLNPDDFLQRRFLDTNGDVAFIMIPILAGMLWIPVTGAPGQCAVAFLLGLCTAGLFTNQVHQWAHMPDPPRLVRILQSCRIILRRPDHARHHLPPYVTDYCIATGWCNGLLNRTGFFPGLERAITWLTGITPREDEVSFEAALQQAPRTSQHGKVGLD